MSVNALSASSALGPAAQGEGNNDGATAARDPVATLTARIQSEADPVRQGQLLSDLDTMTGDRRAGDMARLGASTGAPILMAAAGQAALPRGGGVSVPLDTIRVPDLGPIAIPLSRAGAFGALLTLSGDTPQPTRVDLGDGLQLNISHDQKQAWFTRDTPALLELGPIRIMPGTEQLNVPVTIRDGQLSFDARQLQQAFGRPLPEGVLAMARPAGVPAALQTTSSGIAAAMAGAPDPCRDLPGQRHHIIPAEIMGANEAFLTRIGFKLDQPANMVKLPSNTSQRDTMQEMCGETRPIHSGRHPSDYGRALSEKLSQIEGRNLSPAQSRAAVNRLMGEVRSEITSGRYTSINDPRLAQFIRGLNP